MNLPKDEFMLLSFVNTKLRDEFSSLDDLCCCLSVDKEEILKKLEKIGYKYDCDKNSFC